jgi:hypothetical protein
MAKCKNHASPEGVSLRWARSSPAERAAPLVGGTACLQGRGSIRCHWPQPPKQNRSQHKPPNNGSHRPRAGATAAPVRLRRRTLRSMCFLMDWLRILRFTTRTPTPRALRRSSRDRPNLRISHPPGVEPLAFHPTHRLSAIDTLLHPTFLSVETKHSACAPRPFSSVANEHTVPTVAVPARSDRHGVQLLIDAGPGDTDGDSHSSAMHTCRQSASSRAFNLGVEQAPGMHPGPELLQRRHWRDRHSFSARSSSSARLHRRSGNLWATSRPWAAPTRLTTAAAPMASLTAGKLTQLVEDIYAKAFNRVRWLDAGYRFGHRCPLGARNLTAAWCPSASTH